MKRIVVLLLGLYLGIFVVSAARAEAAVDEERVQAARRFLVALGFADVFTFAAKKGFSEAAKKNPAMTKEMAWAMDQITPEAAADRMAPVYAEFLTAQQADELRLFFSRKPGSTFWRAISEAAVAGKKTSMPPMSKQDKQIIESFVKTSDAWRVMSASQSAINAKLKTAIYAWLQEIKQRGLGISGRQLADAISPETAPADAGGTSRPYAGPVADMIPLMRNYVARNQKGIEEYSAQVDALKLETVLQPTNLVSQEGIEAGRAKVDKFEVALSKRLRDFGSSTDELLAGIKAMPASTPVRQGFIAGMENGAAKSYERALRMEENQRALIALTRQILTLAEQCHGKLRFEDDVLVFDDNADLQTYNGLMERLQKEAALETKLNEEEQRVRTESLRRLREMEQASGQASPAPAGDTASPQ